MNEEYLIKSTDELREVIRPPTPHPAQKITASVDAYQKAFIAKAPILFVSTSDSDGNLEVSPKGDDAGFVELFDSRTLLIPERPGNRLAFGFENIIATGKVGLIFVVPGLIETLRIGGRARISRDPELLRQLSAQGKPAVLCTIVSVEKIWFHCGKALIRSKLWKPETWQENARSNYTEQVAEVLSVDVQIVKKVIEDDYEKNLY